MQLVVYRQHSLWRQAHSYQVKKIDIVVGEALPALDKGRHKCAQHLWIIQATLADTI